LTDFIHRYANSRGASLVGSFALLIGHFAPWARHKTAALTLSAHDLATFTNFTPNAGVLANEWFLAPLWCASILFVLNAKSRWVAVPSIFIASLGFPAYAEMRKILARQPSDFLPQLILTFAVIALVVFLAFKRNRAAQFEKWLPAICAASCIVPFVGFPRIKSIALEELYRETLGIGWGWWATLFGILSLGLFAFVTILSPLLHKLRGR
jgi:hypothetical protein